MSEEAMKILLDTGEVIWADCKNEEELIAKVGILDPKVIITEYFRVTSLVMDASRSLRGIVVWGVGYDHIDVDAASERGIYVVNTKGSNAESVAEHAFSLMLCLSRKTLRLDKYVREGRWVTREEFGLPHELGAQDLRKKTLGIIGLGAIGTRIARIAQGFEMNVLAYNAHLSIETAKRAEVEQVDFDKLLKESDFVTINVTLTKETIGLINAYALGLMKPTAYLINTSRGQILDEDALIKALRDKKIGGAGLDVFSKEPINVDNPLLQFENVVVSPHSAGSSEEALQATSLMVSEEAEKILFDQIPKNLVNKSQLIKKGYVC